MTYIDFVFEIVKTIPAGQVSTYGEVANVLKNKGQRITPNMVGWALHTNKSSVVPCHRVVNRRGQVAPHFAFDGWREQKRRLVSEGVHFVDEKRVDLVLCQFHF